MKRNHYGYNQKYLLPYLFYRHFWVPVIVEASSRPITRHIYRNEEGSYKNCNLCHFWVNSTIRSLLKPGKQLILVSSLSAFVFLWFLQLSCEWLMWACWMFHITNFLWFNPKSHVPPKNFWDISILCMFCLFLIWVVWFCGLSAYLSVLLHQSNNASNTTKWRSL